MEDALEGQQSYSADLDYGGALIII
jgi:hypothetical protein